MCTLTVLRQDGRLLVTMNRDDAAARPEAAPHIWPHTDPAVVAPKDLEAGGTWIGVNEAGVIACLLNRYDAAPAGRTSRGSIVLKALQHRSVRQGLNALETIEHEDFSPFTCLLLSLHDAARLDWTGKQLIKTELPATDEVMMATSSSWRFEEVKAQREALFQQTWRRTGDAHDRVANFHSERDASHDAWAPMMQRPHSQTKSITQIELTPNGAEMRYWTRDAAIASRLTSPEACVKVPASLVTA